MRTCDIGGCDKPHCALGFCQMHYRRNKLYGSPYLTDKRPRDLDSEIQILEWYGWTVTVGGCWEFSGPVDQDGYGRFSIFGRDTRAIRAAYRSWIGPLDDTALVLHSCDNPPCISPYHLRSGSHQDNVDDMFSRGRAKKAFGKRHGHVHYSLEQVNRVRHLFAAGHALPSIATEVGVPRKWAWGVATGRLRTKE